MLRESAMFCLQPKLSKYSKELTNQPYVQPPIVRRDNYNVVFIQFPSKRALFWKYEKLQLKQPNKVYCMIHHSWIDNHDDTLIFERKSTLIIWNHQDIHAFNLLLFHSWAPWSYQHFCYVWPLYIHHYCQLAVVLLIWIKCWTIVCRLW